MGAKPAEIIQLGQLYREKVHRPRTKDNSKAYYVPKSTYAKLSADEQTLLKDKEYMSQCSYKLNSPTNIRRVWIAASGVVVEYYASPKIGRDKSGKALDGDLCGFRRIDIDLKQKALEYVNFNSLTPSQRAFSKDLPAEIRFKGRAFTALTHPYTLNNIEEIYVDWSCLIGEDNEPLLAKAGLSQMQILQTYVSGNRLGQSQAYCELLPFMFTGGQPNTKNYRRLKNIVMISGLDKVINQIPLTVNKFKISNAEIKSTPWYKSEAAMQLIANTDSDIWKYEIQNTTNKNTDIQNFIIKDSQYVFDDILKIKLTSYVEAAKNLMISKTQIKNVDLQKKTEEETQAEESEAIKDNELLAYLEDLRKEAGGETLRAVMQAAFIDLPDKSYNLNKMFKSFGESLGEKYKQLYSS